MENNINNLSRGLFKITGKVLPGLGRGDEVGVKTANLDIGLAKDFTPGLYGCSVLVNETGAVYGGLLYYGHNSLSQKICLEAHLFDFEGNLYNKEIVVTVKNYLRPPEKFDSVEKLKKQILVDLKTAKNL